MRRWMVGWLALGWAVTAQVEEPWLASDVGGVTVPGTSRAGGGEVDIRVAGADIWGTADAFHYVYQPLRGDGAATARILRIDRADDWAKAGIMIRGSLAPGAPYAFVCLTPRNGANFQFRPEAGAEALESEPRRVPASAPLWVALDRSGNRFSASIRAGDGEWQPLGSITANLPEEALVGLAVTSHANRISARGQFSGVAVYDR